MKARNYQRHRVPAFALLLSACFNSAMAQEAPPAAPATPPAATVAESLSDADLEFLGTAAKRFVEAFNRKDAAAIAALFLPDGEIIGGDGETFSGREEIEAHYAEVFAAEKPPLVSLEANSVRLVAPGVVVEDGVTHLTTSDDEPATSVAYSATHIKQSDGSWLIDTNTNQPEITAPVERLKPLYWLAGEWTLEGEDGLRVDMVLDLDDNGSFLLGEALVTDTEGDSQTTQIRIGWNPATESIYWWTFDSRGGFTAGPWARDGSDWTIASTGFTADSEACSTIQTLKREREDLMVWTAEKRLLVDETETDDTLRFVRRAPDPGPLANEPDTSAGDDEEAAPAKE